MTDELRKLVGITMLDAFERIDHKALTEIITIVRAATVEECAKVMCRYCADGTPVEFRDGNKWTMSKSGWHHLGDVGGLVGSAYCEATPIRSLSPGKEGR